jgi:hypothetical protein
MTDSPRDLEALVRATAEAGGKHFCESVIFEAVLRCGVYAVSGERISAFGGELSEALSGSRISARRPRVQQCRQMALF